MRKLKSVPLDPKKPDYTPPSWRDPSFVWVHSSKTDVQETWRRFGWTPKETK